MSQPHDTVSTATPSWQALVMRRTAYALVLCLGTTARAQDCPDPDRATGWARDAVLQFSFAEADQHALLAEEGFGCSAPATPEQAARLHLLRAARYDYDGQKGRRDAYLASARAASSEYDDSFGPELRALWETARASGTGAARLPGLPAGWVVWVDGTVHANIDELAAGPHLLQMGPSRTEVRWAKTVFVPEGEGVLVDIPSQAFEPREPVPDVPDEPAVVVPEPEVANPALEVVLPDPVVVLPEHPQPSFGTTVPTPPSPSSSTRKKGGTLVWVGVGMAVAGTAGIIGSWSAGGSTRPGEPGAGALISVNTSSWIVGGAGIGLGVIGVGRGARKTTVGVGPNQLWLHQGW